jgi:hypothetical protein
VLVGHFHVGGLACTKGLNEVLCRMSLRNFALRHSAAFASPDQGRAWSLSVLPVVS